MTLQRLGFVLGIACIHAYAAGQSAPATEITFSKDVAPIFYKSCVTCHHPNDIAPMSLVTFKEARPWAAAIREAVTQRIMPPWHADPHVGHFINDPRLSDQEIATIQAWVKSGAQEGDPKDLPAPPVFQNGWHIKPDIILAIPETTVAAQNQDDYEYIKMGHRVSQSTRNKGTRLKILGSVQELEGIASKLDTWDPDPAKVQRQIDAFVNSLYDARLLKRRKKKRTALHEAIKDLRIKVRDRDRIVVEAESLEDLINGYEEDIDKDDIENARDIAAFLVEELRKALQSAAHEHED